MKHTLTHKEEQFLIEIIEAIAANGHPPSVREAQKIGGFASSRTATQYLERLEAKGFIERGRAARSLKVLIDPRDARRSKRKTPRKEAARAEATPIRPRAALLVNATELDGWSHLIDSQSMLPQIVRKLVLATTDGTGTVRFRSGEGVQLPGFDGYTDFDRKTSFVPAGPAVWELGTSGDIEKKAQSDYRARTGDPNGIETKKATFIFVTSRRWREKDAWAQRRRAEGRWRDVQVYDADDLETWLELAPTVHRSLSHELGKDPDGASDLATFAASWFEATKPALAPSFLIAGRDQAVDAVKQWLTGSTATLSLRGETREEVVAFFASVLTLLGEEERLRHELRSVVVRDEIAWQKLAATRDSLILLPLFVPSSVTAAERNGHRVVLPLTLADRNSPGAVDLGPLGRESVEAVLRELLAKGRSDNVPAKGVSDAKTRQLAQLARRSVMAFRRVHARSAELSHPAWAAGPTGPFFALIMLVGAWKDSREGDRDTVSRIVGMPYAQIERELVRWARETDAPVRHIGDRWMLTSKEDTWPLLHDYLSREDLRRFNDVAVEVFAAVDPRFDLDAEQQWMASLYGKVRPHSGTLLTAIADTLALLGARGDETRATAGESAQAFAASAVRRVLDAANQDVRIWFSVGGVLPLLAEAAPSQFLDAVEKGLAGSSPVLREIFTDKPGTSSLTSSSPHVNVLWALERVAWAAEHLPRAAAALAKLDQLDHPRGTTGNRPDSSLRQLLLCWHPQTHATVDQRLQVVDRLRKTHAPLAWRLLISLLPNDHDFSMDHHAAEWRDWGVEQPRLTRADVVRGYRQVIARVIEDVGTDPARWKDLIGKLEKIPREEALRAIEKLEAVSPTELDHAGRETLRSALRESIAWHRAHPDAKWELTTDDVARLEAIHNRIEPADDQERFAWLFTRAPELLSGAQTYSDEYDELLSAERVTAVTTILSASGVEGLLAFASAVEMPNEVGAGLALSGRVDDQALDLITEHLASADATRDRFSRGFTFQEIRKRGVSWAHELLAMDALSAAQRGVVLTFLPYDDEDTWRAVDAQDADVQREYWTRMYPWGVPDRHAERLVRQLVKHGRPFTAADVLAGYVHSGSKKTPSPEVIADTLDAVLSATDVADPVPSHFGYDLGELVETLAKVPGSVPVARIAAIEWQLVPLLANHDLEPRILHAELVRDPAFFTEIVSLVYRPKSGPADGEEAKEPTENDRRKTRAAYRLLESCRTFPARRPDGSIDVASLTAWVTKSRELLAEADRAAIGDLQIGEILGGSPMGDDGIWPHEAVRQMIESIESPEIERGIALRVYNSRGVVSKDLREGGAQERELVRKYTTYAEAINGTAHRTAALLRTIAEFYESDAARSDTDVEVREHLGF